MFGGTVSKLKEGDVVKSLVDTDVSWPNGVVNYVYGPDDGAQFPIEVKFVIEGRSVYSSYVEDELELVSE
jgi:hypothetical protein